MPLIKANPVTDTQTTMPTRKQVFFILLVCFVALIHSNLSAQRRGSGSRGSGLRQSGVAMSGYCPVCIIDMKKWVKGNPNYQTRFDGKTYYFPTAKIKQTFDTNPVKYVPALGGDCTVCLAEMGKRMPGSVYYSAYHKQRLFLFPGEKQKKMFVANPTKYANVDLAFGGNCSVCKVEMKQDLPGKPEYTAVYRGMRYQFPGEKQMKMFIANPSKYAVQGAAGSGNRNQPPASRQPSALLPKQALPLTKAEPRVIQITGTSTCAGCEHGISPLGAPEELGLAVDAKDGKVYVIEDAHKLYPKLYENRFQELPVQVTGIVLQEKKNIRWLKPTELKMLN